MDVSDNRLQDLEARTYHIDGRVSAIETQLTTQGATLSRVEQHLLGMSKGKEPNIVGWVGLTVTGLLGILSLVFTMAKYMDLQLAPLRSSLAENEEVHKVFEQFRHQQHYEVGTLHTQKDQVQREIDKLWNHIHKQEEIDRDQDDRLARGEVARKALGDYVRQIDELGSRRWMHDMPIHATKTEPTRK